MLRVLNVGSGGNGMALSIGYTSNDLIDLYLREGQRNPRISMVFTKPFNTVFLQRARKFKEFLYSYDSRDSKLHNLGPNSRDYKLNYVRRELMPNLHAIYWGADIDEERRGHVLSEYNRHLRQWGDSIHKNVIRRAVKAGYLTSEGFKGKNFDNYTSKVVYGGTDFHDVAQHGVLGATPSWAGEAATEHLTHIMNDVKDNGFSQYHPSKQNRKNSGTGHLSEIAKGTLELGIRSVAKELIRIDKVTDLHKHVEDILDKSSRIKY